MRAATYRHHLARLYSLRVWILRAICVGAEETFSASLRYSFVALASRFSACYSAPGIARDAAMLTHE